MKNNVHLLKWYRVKSQFAQQDVAALLNIDPGNLNRYETEKRLPTPEILITYHILFGVPLDKLLQPLYKTVRSNILRRSQRLIPQLVAMQTPKSKHRLAYLNSIVKELSQKQNYDE